MFLGIWEAEIREGKLYLPEKWLPSIAKKTFSLQKDVNPGYYILEESSSAVSRQTMHICEDGGILIDDLPALLECQRVIGNGSSILLECTSSGAFARDTERYAGILDEFLKN